VRIITALFITEPLQHPAMAATARIDPSTRILQERSKLSHLGGQTVLRLKTPHVKFSSIDFVRQPRVRGGEVISAEI
jgi:hypothetical protein